MTTECKEWQKKGIRTGRGMESESEVGEKRGAGHRESNNGTDGGRLCEGERQRQGQDEIGSQSKKMTRSPFKSESLHFVSFDSIRRLLLLVTTEKTFHVLTTMLSRRSNPVKYQKVLQDKKVFSHLMFGLTTDPLNSKLWHELWHTLVCHPLCPTSHTASSHFEEHKISKPG